MYIYMYFTGCLFPLQNSRTHMTVLCKRINGSLNRLFFIQRIMIYTGSTYCKVKILLLLNKKRATLLHMNELITGEERKNTVLNFKGHMNLSAFFIEIRKSNHGPVNQLLWYMKYLNCVEKITLYFMDLSIFPSMHHIRKRFQKYKVMMFSLFSKIWEAVELNSVTEEEST